MRTLVTIGTDELWAPPRMCGFELTDDFELANTNKVWWDIHAEGTVTRWAIKWATGWWAHPLPPVGVDPNFRTPALLAVGALRVTIHAPGESLGLELPTAVRFPEIGSPTDT